MRAWVGMAGYVLATQYWLLPSAGPLLAVLAVVLGALWLPWGWAVYRLLSGSLTTRRMLAAVVVLPSAWVIAEAARSWERLGGPWALLGASQWTQPATMASASLGGVWLTSFLIVGCNTAVVGAILLRSARVVAAAIVIGFVAVGPAWFWFGPSPAPGTTIRIALAQPGNIEDATARQAAAEALTAELAGQRLDLVVWGESSVGVDLTSHPEAMARLADLSRRVGADLLVNVDARAPAGGIHKSAVLIGPNGARGSYSKTRLVPFGEYVPLRPLLGWATRHTKAAAEDRRRGGGPVVLNTRSLAIGPLISFEATFSDLPRREVQLGAELLAYQSSTSTYQGSWAQPSWRAWSRSTQSRWDTRRARGLSGVSSAFDAHGRKLAWFPATSHGVIVVDVPLGSRTTVYQRIGDWVLALAFSIVVCAGVRAGLREWCAR